jgi:hypothetical protein
VFRLHARRLVVMGFAAAMLGVLAGPRATAAGGLSLDLRAELEGQPLALSAVASYYCDDFSYPVIKCFTSPDKLEARAEIVLSVTAVDYVTIYDYTTWAGSYMHVSQNYSALVFIGWNDRVSSYRAKNSETGRFWTDWFYSGTIYNFCCNQMVSSLGSFDNTFSAIERT